MKILYGKPVADNIILRLDERLTALKDAGYTPTLATVKIGANDADSSYERMIGKKCQAAGLNHRQLAFDEDISEKELLKYINELNEDRAVDGVLLFRPLPGHINEQRVRNALSISKDIDGMTDGSLAGLMSDGDDGFAPCTAQAVMELLEYYNIEPSGKNVAVIGRSLVIGKPVSLMLLRKNATVTICHSRTYDLKSISSKADIVIACIGRAKYLSPEYFSENQVIIDVGINVDEQGRLCGDVDTEALKEPAAVTPVPNGVGSVTTSVLIKNTIISACRSRQDKS